MRWPALELRLPFVYQTMTDVTRVEERTEQAFCWLRKIKADMPPRDWGEFIHWFVNDSENRSVFLRVHEDLEGGPIVLGTDDPIHPRLAGVILYFPNAHQGHDDPH
jgi:hypothetical protein